MTFYERLRSLKPQAYQDLCSTVSRYGNPQEIFAYINAMPLCCQEDVGMFKSAQSEVRIDQRFLVICRQKDIGILPTGLIENFYISPWESSTYCWFGINGADDLFFVEKKSGYALYSRLTALCPNFFQPLSHMGPVRLNDYRYSYLTVDNQNITLSKLSLLGKSKIKLVLPVKNIRSCYQLTDDDCDGNSYKLYFCMQDGSEPWVYVQGNADGFHIARRLKAVNPNLIYECWGTRAKK